VRIVVLLLLSLGIHVELWPLSVELLLLNSQHLTPALHYVLLFKSKRPPISILRRTIADIPLDWPTGVLFRRHTP
jgi:hypothetical protein